MNKHTKTKTKLKALQGGLSNEMTLNEHELSVARQANEAVALEQRRLGQLRASYIEAESEAFKRMAVAHEKLAKLAEAALVARGLPSAGNWSIDFETGKMEKKG